MPASALMRATWGALSHLRHGLQPPQPHGSHSAACRVLKGIAFVQGASAFSQGGPSRRPPARKLLHTRMGRG